MSHALLIKSIKKKKQKNGNLKKKCHKKQNKSQKKSQQKIDCKSLAKKCENRKKKAKHWLTNSANFPTSVLPNRPTYNIFKANKTKKNFFALR